MKHLTKLLLPACTGLLLFLSDRPVGFLPLQLAAWIPLLHGLRDLPSARRAALHGMLAGLCWTLPMLVVLDLPMFLGGGLALYLSLLMASFAILARLGLRRGGPVCGALCVGAAGVLVSWCDYHLIPVWGTAQSFVRPWSRAPWSVQFVAFTGMLGVVFVLLASQALLLSYLRVRRARPAFALMLLLAVPAGLNAFLWTRPMVQTVRVGTVGWKTKDMSPGLYDSLLAEAAERGARVVVSPETGFDFVQGTREVRLGRLAVQARHHGVNVAVGYFDEERNDNRVVVIDETGTPRGEYVKNHLIPSMETYRAGDGAVMVTVVAGITTGVLICQDDNFTDLSRRYGRAGVEILLVPTNDWLEVANYHLDSSRFRAIETGAAIVRAASNGVSAVITPRGELLATHDHNTDGAGVLVAAVPVRRMRTVYALVGDWPMLGLAVGLLGYLLRRRTV